MTYLDEITKKYGKQLGVQPLEIVASTTTGKYTFPNSNTLLEKCLLLAVTSRAIPTGTTRYSPLDNTLLNDSVTDQSFLTLKCGANDIISQIPLQVITDMEEQGLVHPLYIQGLTLDKSMIYVPQASTVMSGKTGQSFLLHFYGLFN